MATVYPLPVRIDAGQFLSHTVDAGDNIVVGLIMPTAWTPARVSILAAVDDINFYDLFNFDADSTTATEFKFNVSPSVIVAIHPDTLLMARYVKLRSGTRDEPVLQEADRDFIAITVKAT